MGSKGLTLVDLLLGFLLISFTLGTVVMGYMRLDSLALRAREEEFLARGLLLASEWYLANRDRIFSSASYYELTPSEVSEILSQGRLRVPGGGNLKIQISQSHPYGVDMRVCLERTGALSRCQRMVADWAKF